MHVDGVERTVIREPRTELPPAIDARLIEDERGTPAADLQDASDRERLVVVDGAATGRIASDATEIKVVTAHTPDIAEAQLD